MPYELILIFLLPIVPLAFYLLGARRLASGFSIISGLLELIIIAYLFSQQGFEDQIFKSVVSKISGNDFLSISFWISSQSITFLSVVSMVSLMVRIYAWKYMQTDNRKAWFLTLVSFFTFSMYGIVLSSNLLLLFFFWEWVGLASYLMIGFWYSKPKAAAAAKKSFLFNKVGDLGLIMALAIIYFSYSSFELDVILENNLATGKLAILMSIGFAIAALAKSAQLPFSMWLVDAMEGPTPASALIHSATMVTAGIYLLIRVFPILDPSIIEALLYIGILTVIWSGLAALRQNDIKRILAYSTISQLGFMLLALGSFNPDAGFFHLIGHAFFKSALFLIAGLVIAEQSKNLEELGFNEDPKDIRFMRSFYKRSPVLSILFIFNIAALSALPLFSSFLSKEAILSGLSDQAFILILAIFASLITALYSGRLLFHLLKPNIDQPIKSIERLVRNEKISLSYLPIFVLTLLSFFIFYSFNPFDFHSSWLYTQLPKLEPSGVSEFALKLISVIMAVAGILLAFVQIYKRQSDINFGENINTMLINGFYFDKVIEKGYNGMLTLSIRSVQFIELKILDRLISFLTYAFVLAAMIARLFDQYVIDGFVNALAYVSSFFSETARQFQGGNLRNYLYWLVLFLLLGLFLFM